MSHTIPTALPKSLVAGDSWQWDKSLSEYPASEGYTYKTKLILKNTTGTVIDISSDANGDTHEVRVSAEDSNAYEAGAYRFNEYVESDAGERFTLKIGDITVYPNPETATDIRSYYEKIVEMIDAVLLGEATDNVKSYTIKNRTLAHYDITELKELRAMYSGLAYEAAQERGDDMGTNRKGHYAKFT